MDPKACSLLFFLAASLCLSATTTSAFNITNILAGYPNFNNFNQLLTQTGLAKLINARSTITVLAVADGAMGAINGKPLDVAKRILSTHVVLDYYDNIKFGKLKSKSTILTTLYQTTGIADDQQGFLNVTKGPNGILFGSAAKGAPLNAHLVGSVMNRPYNISVIEVSAVIVAPGIDSLAPAKAPSPKKAPPPRAEAPEPAAAPEPAEAPEPAASDSPAPADAPTPTADASPADSPADDSPADKAKSAASSHVSCAAALILGLVATLGLF